jgi:hypothetical protein
MGSVGREGKKIQKTKLAAKNRERKKKKKEDVFKINPWL